VFRCPPVKFFLSLHAGESWRCTHGLPTGQLACLRAPYPWPRGHTVQRRSGRNAWNWAVGCFKAKDPSLLDWVRRAWAPQQARGAFVFRVGLRGRIPAQEQGCMCTGHRANTNLCLFECKSLLPPECGCWLKTPDLGLMCI
jgi:hypothetical protein